MSAYRYYALENARYNKEHTTLLSRTDMAEMTDALCDHFGRPRLPVLFSDGRDLSGAKTYRVRSHETSWFNEGATKEQIQRRRDVNARLRAQGSRPMPALCERAICYGIRMMNALTVAHEVAHYLHFMEYRDLVAEWEKSPETTETAVKTGALTITTTGRGPRPTIKRAHGPEHAAWVARCVEVIASKRAAKIAQAAAQTTFQTTFTKIAGEIFEVAKDPIKAFYDSLPERLTCPCCNATLPKMNFGVRVMKRDADNNPTVIRRQSYCRACR